MTLNIKPLADAITTQIKALEQAQDLESVRTATVYIAEKVQAQMQLMQNILNDYEKRLANLDTFAMRVKNHLER